MKFKTVDGKELNPETKLSNAERIKRYLDKLPDGIVINGNVELAREMGRPLGAFDHQSRMQDVCDYFVKTNKEKLWANRKTIIELRKQVGI